MPRCVANGIEIEYDSIGSPTNPGMLLVMGLSMQLTGWDPELCALLAKQGFHVIRFDNRDVGLSTHLDDAPLPDPLAVLGGDTSGVPYLLADMADDAAGLLTALGVSGAHVVGVSMGGMIVQELLLRHPELVLSACSIMSTTGASDVGQPSAEAAAALVAPRAATREEAIKRGVGVWRILESPAYPQPEAVLWEQESARYNRSFYPDGPARQLAAILASPDRTPGLRRRHRAHARHPRRRRPADQRQRRQGDGRRHPGRTAEDLPRYGPRPAAGALGFLRGGHRHQRTAGPELRGLMQGIN